MSSRLELVPTFPGRPVTVRLDEWVVFVSVHDAWHIRERARLKAAIVAAHPDHGGSRTALSEAMEHWTGFQQREWIWYRAHDITPPSRLDTSERYAPAKLSEREAAVLRLVCAHPGIILIEMAAFPDMPSMNAIRQALQRLIVLGLISISARERCGVRSRFVSRYWPTAAAIPVMGERAA